MSIPQRFLKSSTVVMLLIILAEKEAVHAGQYSNIVALNNTTTDLTCNTSCNVSLKWERCSWPDNPNCTVGPSDMIYKSTSNRFSEDNKERALLNNSIDGQCVYKPYKLLMSDAGQYICSTYGTGTQDIISTINLIMLGSPPDCTMHQEQLSNIVQASCSLNYSGQQAPVMTWYTQFDKQMSKINETYITNDATTSTVKYSVNISDLVDGTTLTCWIPFNLSDEYHHANAPYNGYSIWNSSNISWLHQTNPNGLETVSNITANVPVISLTSSVYEFNFSPKQSISFSLHDVTNTPTTILILSNASSVHEFSDTSSTPNYDTTPLYIGIVVPCIVLVTNFLILTILLLKYLAKRQRLQTSANCTRGPTRPLPLEPRLSGRTLFAHFRSTFTLTRSTQAEGATRFSNISDDVCNPYDQLPLEEPSSSEQPADTAASTPIYAQVQKSTKVKEDMVNNQPVAEVNRPLYTQVNKSTKPKSNQQVEELCLELSITPQTTDQFPTEYYDKEYVRELDLKRSGTAVLGAAEGTTLDITCSITSHTTDDMNQPPTEYYDKRCDAQGAATTAPVGAEMIDQVEDGYTSIETSPT